MFSSASRSGAPTWRPRRRAPTRSDRPPPPSAATAAAQRRTASEVATSESAWPFASRTRFSSAGDAGAATATRTATTGPRTRRPGVPPGRRASRASGSTATGLCCSPRSPRRGKPRPSRRRGRPRPSDPLARARSRAVAGGGPERVAGERLVRRRRGPVLVKLVNDVRHAGRVRPGGRRHAHGWSRQAPLAASAAAAASARPASYAARSTGLNASTSAPTLRAQTRPAASPAGRRASSSAAPAPGSSSAARARASSAWVGPMPPPSGPRRRLPRDPPCRAAPPCVWPSSAVLNAAGSSETKRVWFVSSRFFPSSEDGKSVVGFAVTSAVASGRRLCAFPGLSPPSPWPHDGRRLFSRVRSSRSRRSPTRRPMPRVAIARLRADRHPRRDCYQQLLLALREVQLPRLRGVEVREPLREGQVRVHPRHLGQVLLERVHEAPLAELVGHRLRRVHLCGSATPRCGGQPGERGGAVCGARAGFR